MKFKLPALFAVREKLHKNWISRLEWVARDQDRVLERYDRQGVQGSLFRRGDSDVLVIDRKSQTKAFDHVLQVSDLTKPENWGSGKWIRPRPEGIADAAVAPADVLDSWKGKFTIVEETIAGEAQQPGLRSPQVGALYATLAHWRVSTAEATVVLPTGTGKTEAMLGVYTHQRLQKLLVVVPTSALRVQLGEKFQSLGVLRNFGILPNDALLPYVGILEKGITSANDVEEFVGRCNVIVATMDSLRACGLAGRTAFAEHCSHMFVDEAHHLPAGTWDDFRKMFAKRDGVVLQFTATPFRRDGRRLPGRIIFHYPLAAAQKAGYFTKVNFRPLLEFDENQHDLRIAEAAVRQLDADRELKIRDDSGEERRFDHVVLARCSTITRATDVHEIYKRIAPHHSPVLLHSGPGLSEEERRTAVSDLFNGKARIVVCVDMFGEGFDYPPLKIGALHDVHKSIGITLQFTGRFARSLPDLGDATIIANLAQAKVYDALERLYAEDADWNQLLSFVADAATREEKEVHDFMTGFANLAESPVSIRNLTPAMSTLVYEAEIRDFHPHRIEEAFDDEDIVGQYHPNLAENLAFIITRKRQEVGWGQIGHLLDVEHDLYVAYWNEAHNLLFVYGSNRNGSQYTIAKKLLRVDEPRIISGEDALRVFGDVRPLTLMNLGLKDAVNRRVRFTMFVGSDIRGGVDDLMQQNRIMTNLFGRGFQEGREVDYGSSRKGRVWSYRTSESLLDWKRWCERIAERIRDESYTREKILEHVLVPREVSDVPAGAEPLSVTWDDAIWRMDEARLYFEFGEEPAIRVPLLNCELRLIALSDNRKDFTVEVVGAQGEDAVVSEYRFSIATNGMNYRHVSGPKVATMRANTAKSLAEFFDDYPPQFRFSDGSLLIENTWYDISFDREEVFDEEEIEAWDWEGVDLTKESLWKDGAERPTSIQRRVLDHILEAEEHELVFNDDDSGEAADIIAMNVDEANRVLHVVLYHLKYTRDDPGERVGDLYTVCGQAQTSVHWKSHLHSLFPHMRSRAAKAATRGFDRYVRGGTPEMKKCEYYAGRIDLDFRVVIVQPGLQKSKVTDDQRDLLAATRAYLHHTLAVPLGIIASP